MPNSKKDKNIVIFNLVLEDDDIFYDEVLFFYYQIDEDCVVTNVMEFG